MNCHDDQLRISHVTLVHSDAESWILSLFPYRAIWRGGEYIEIFHLDSEVPIDVINVWDYENNCHTLSLCETQDDLSERFQNWYQEAMA